MADLSSDEERGAAFREAMRFPLQRMCDLMEEAKSLGLRINFTLGDGCEGRVIITHLDVVKVL